MDMRTTLLLLFLLVGTSSAEIIPSLCWKTELTGLVDAIPSYDSGSTYVTNWYGWSDWKKGLYKINATNGLIEWRNEAISGAGKALVVGNTVVIGNLSGHLYFVNPTSGEIEKSIPLEDSPSYWGIASSPVYHEGTIYVQTFSNSTLWALSTDGKLKWKFSANVEGSPYASPFAFDDKIFFSAGNRLFCLNKNGMELWNFTTDSKITNSPVVGDNKIFFSTERSFYALKLNGEYLWNRSFNGTISNAVLSGGLVCLGGKNGLSCFNSTNGDLVWEFPTEGKVDSTPAIHEGRIYFATNTQYGTLYALNLSIGELLWFYRLVPPSRDAFFNIMSSPVIAEEKLFIGADSGYVYCFNSSGTVELNVTLYPGNYTERVNGNEYRISRTSALGALHSASSGSRVEGAEIGFSYRLDDSWYSSFGLLLKSAMGLGELYWTYYINSEMPWSAMDKVEMSDGDTLYLIYGTGFETPENASTMIKINVAVKPAGIESVSVSPGARGGNITAFVNVSTIEGWYVLVLSGINAEGDSIAGVATFHSKGDLRVPAIVAVPQQVKTGTYKLYAGIYRLEEYPDKLVSFFGPVEVEVR
jgi:outer membrane protein assembly factor BamB